MKKIIINGLTIIICGLITACSTNSNKGSDFFFDNQLIQEILNEENSEFPSHFIGIFFFCKCQDEKVILLDVREFKHLYKKIESEMSYKDFLTKLLNQALIVDCDSERRVFKIDKKIEQEYQHKKISEFITLYCNRVKDESYILKEGYSKNEIESILYFLFINNYLATYDDYAGFYIVTKSSSFY